MPNTQRHYLLGTQNKPRISVQTQTQITHLALWNFRTGKHKEAPEPLPSQQCDTLGFIFYLRFVYPSSTICYKTELCCVLSQSDIFADLAGLINTFCFLRDTVVSSNPGLPDNPSGTISGDCLYSVCEHKDSFSTFTYHLFNNNFQLF